MIQALRKLSLPSPRALLAPPLHPLPEALSPAGPTHRRASHLDVGDDSRPPTREEGRSLRVPSSRLLAGPLLRVLGGTGLDNVPGEEVRCVCLPPPPAAQGLTAPATGGTCEIACICPGVLRPRTWRLS